MTFIINDKIIFKSLLLLFKTSLVILIHGKSEESQHSEHSLHIVYKVNVVYKLTFINCILALYSCHCQTKHTVSQLANINICIECFITISCFDVADFVFPPHDRFPIRLIIFEKFSDIVWVFSHSANYVFFTSLLVPFQALECKYFQSL